MSDIGEIFKEYAKERRERKERNLTCSIAILEKNEVPFVSHSAHHLLVRGHVDYWPSTGLWIDRRTKRRGRGVMNLLRFFELGKK